MEKKNKISNRKLIGRFLPYYKSNVPVLALDLFCAALTTLCEIILPLIIRYLTDTGMNDMGSLTVGTILGLGGLYIALRLIDTAANYYMAVYGHIMGTKIETDMRRDMFGHLQKLSFSYFDNMKIGQIMSRITTDLFDVTEFAHHCPEEFFIAGLKIIIPFIILATYNLPLTLIIFAVIPPMAFIAGHYNRKMRAAFRRQREQIGELNARVEDSLLGIRVVKSFANEKTEERKFESGNKLFFDIKKLSYSIMGAFGSSNRIFEGLMYATVVIAGALFMINGKITVADFTAYLLYVNTFTASVRRIIEFTEQFQRGMSGIERFCNVMDTKPDIVDLPEATELENVEGVVEFHDVSFSYGEGGENVLNGINLKIEKGQHIAIVGPSGGGKTTLCNLIPRFYEVTEGKITVDGRDIRDITLQSLRSNIGIVQQDVYLFSGTVIENIAYGRENATMEEIEEAAKLAGAHDFITKLTDGYNTYVGERGVKLSGGQKQRIAIARVFLKNPPILILDEATSALDNESEHLVQKSLARLSEGRTTLTIAHRLTTIKNADEILVLTENGIEEKGTHDELLTSGGKYAELYKLYTE